MSQSVGKQVGETEINSAAVGVAQEVNKVSSQKEISQSRLVLMWALILIGYFLFVVQWYSIGNFSGGYNQNIGNVTGNPALSSMPNWTITFMRGIGSILAGLLIAKIGHKYAVVTVLSLMVLSFPFLIVIGIKWPEGEYIGKLPDGSGGYHPLAFGLFLFFRLFLAIGGTTLITYTNSVIAKMPNEKKPTFMTINQFGFNGGAFFANIFFCFGLSSVINGNIAIWLTILALFVALIALMLVVYIFLGKEVVPVKKTSSTFEANDVSYLKVFKESYTWKMSTIFIVWLVAVVFINSSTMRTFIEQSPANLETLIRWNAEHGKFATNLAGTTLGTATSVVVGSGYNWVWPTFICMFVSGFFVGLIFISPFSKTIFKRKMFINLMFILGYVFALASLMVGYFGGYGNTVSLAFFFILIFISGMFLWAVQPVLLSLYQQAPQSSPKYAGIIAGLIWGIGYVGYTVSELSLSLISSEIEGTKFNDAVTAANSLLKVPGADVETILPKVMGEYVNPMGNTIVIVLFFVILALVFIPINMLPAAGIKDKSGNFIPFTKEWKPWEWNFKKPENLISNQ